MTTRTTIFSVGRGNSMPPPERCPDCRTEMIYVDRFDPPVWRCPNPKCKLEMEVEDE